MVSGFCAIFGMKIATGKFRTFQVNFGKQERAEYSLDKLVIQLATKWHPVSVPVKHEGSLNYLEVTFDVNKSSKFYQTMYNDHIQKARHICGVIGRRKFSPTTKILVAQLSSLASVKKGPPGRLDYDGVS